MFKSSSTNQIINNSKFSRTDAEEELAVEFFKKNKVQINKYENEFYEAIGNAYAGTNEEQIKSCIKSIEIWDKYKEWCYKTKGGTIHFQDKWEHCHNTNNTCFSYIDDIREHLYNLQNGIDDSCLTYGVSVKLAYDLEELIKKSPGILQKDIYDILCTDKKQELINYISYLEYKESILRLKNKNTYELYWNDKDKNMDLEEATMYNDSNPKLIKCPCCGKEVSNQAITCPNCGQPIKDNILCTEEYNNDLSTIDYKGIEESITSRKKKKKKNFTGCLTTIIFLFVVCAIVGQLSKNSTNNTEKYINVSAEAGTEIDKILEQCGLTNIKGIEHDELLDNAHFDGEKGYRVSTKSLDNIILYLYADNVVYSVRYADKDLFLKGTLLATINDYTMTIEEMTKWQILCENSVKGILKSPATAKFPNISKWGFMKEKDIVTIRSYVDSQNGFGAEVRSDFQFVVNSADSTIQSFIFDGQELVQ